MTSRKDLSTIPLRQEKTLPWPLMVIFLFLIAVVVVSGLFYYQKQKRQALLEQTSDFQAIADLKAATIANWLQERIGDARLVLLNQDRIALLSAFLRDRTGDLRREAIQRWMTVFCDVFRYENVLLIDRQGTVVLSVHPHSAMLGNEGQKALDDARRRRNVAFSDLHRSGQPAVIHMGVVVPLLVGDDVTGFLLLRIDPEDFLFPLIQSWPTASPSAETLLVRRDGDSVLFLNELRHRKGTAMKLRLSLTSKKLPAVKAILGKTGPMSGRDYRGVAVWSVTRAVADTPWFIVTKVDLDEIERPLRRSALAIILVALSLILATALLILLIWQRQHNRFRLRQLEALREKEALVKHFDYLSRFANDLILLSDSEHNIVEANERAVQAYGYGREQLLAMNIRMLRAPNERESIDDDYRQARERDGIIFEARHLRRDGSTFPVEVSARVIRSQGKEYFQSIYRDISERKQAEQKLAESEQFLASVIEQKPSSLWISDDKGTLMKMNRACRELFGVTENEVVGKYNILKDNLVEAQGQLPLVRDVFEKGMVARFQLEYDARDVKHIDVKVGRHRILDVVVSPIRDAQGNVSNAIVQHRDITDLQRAEEALRSSEEKYSMAFLTSPYAITITRVEDGGFIEVNDAFTSITEYTREEALANSSIGMKLWVNEEDRESVVADLRAGRVVESREYHFNTKSGKIITGMFSAHIIRLGSGPCILSSINDISQRKRAEEKLQEQHARLRIAGELARIGGWSVNLEENRSYWSDEVAAIHEMPPGYSPLVEEGINFYTPEWRERIQEVFSACAQNGIPYNEEMEIITATGKRLWVHAMGEAVRNDKGKIFKVHGAFQDITARKKAEDEIRSLNDELEERVRQRTAQFEAANKELEAFSYSVSHDLRAPLRAIDGFSRIILEDYAPRLDKEGKRLLSVITANTQKMGHLIDDLLAFSRLNRQQLATTQVNLAVIAKVVCRELKNSEKNRKIEFKVGALPVAHGDQAMLQHVLQNLLANAVKFTRTRPMARIELSGKAGPCETVYRVKDNGVGFDARYADKLFGVFQRLHSADEFEGTGVGLAIVQRIIQRHGGRVWAESKAGKGATFFFALPMEKGTGDRGQGTGYREERNKR